MHRFTFDLASRRTWIVVAITAAAALAIAAFVVDPGSRGGTTTVTEDGGGEVSVPGGDDAVGATEPVLDPAVDPAAPVAEFAGREELADGGSVARDAIAATGAGGDASEAAIETDGGGLAAPDLDLRIVRNGAVELRVPQRRFEQAWGDVQAVATGSGGYVIGASRSGAGDSSRRATITMRVPGARFEAALERLRDVRGAKVGRLDVSSQDVTQEYVDTRSRLRHDRAVEGRLLALLADADGVGDVLAVQARLDMVQQQIEVARGRLQYLDKLTEMGTIEVSIVTPAAPGREREERSELGEAFTDAGERFVGNVADAVVWVGGALPALILLAIAAIVGRTAWRRRTHVDQRPVDPT